MKDIRGPQAGGWRAAIVTAGRPWTTARALRRSWRAFTLAVDEQFAESARLETAVGENLAGLGYDG
jgi:hypothetical protein